MKAAHYRESQDGTLEVHRLSDHLQSVAALSRANAKKINLEEAGEILGLVHDLGKYGVDFQNYLASAVGLSDQDADGKVLDATALKGKIDHSTSGAQFLWLNFPGQEFHNHCAKQILALCLASHHSGLIDCLTSSPSRPVETTFLNRMGKPDDQTHLGEALEEADPGILARAKMLLDSPEIARSFQVLLGQISGKVQAENGAQALLSLRLGLVARFLLSGLVDARASRPGRGLKHHRQRERGPPAQSPGLHGLGVD